MDCGNFFILNRYRITLHLSGTNYFSYTGIPEGNFHHKFMIPDNCWIVERNVSQIYVYVMCELFHSFLDFDIYLKSYFVSQLNGF